MALLMVGFTSPAWSADSCAPLPPGAISWWPAESSAQDSLDGNHGSLVGNTAYGAGRKGVGFMMDGNRDGVLVGMATNLQLQNFSVEGWIRRTSATTISFNGNGGAEIFALGSGGGGFGFYLRPDARLALGKLQVNECTSTASITDTNWHHHVVVTKTNSTVVFYLDGVAHPAPAYNSGGFTYSGPGYVGAWRNPSGLVDNSFYGTIDELAVYNRGLTAAEIQAIYTASANGKCPTITTNPSTICHEAAAAFATNSNPNGVWSYGFSMALGGGFQKFNETGLYVNQFLMWRSNIWLSIPMVLKNATTGALTSISMTLQPGQLAFHPGPNGEFCVVRFTCPSNGIYQVTGGFTGADIRGTTTDVHVLRNGAALFNGVVNGYGAGSGPGFSTNLTLQSGDWLDFVVGWGANGDFNFDTTTLAASVCLLTNSPPLPTDCVTVPGAVSWWRAASNALDSVDGNHGTFSGNVTYGAGRVGSAFVLDGNADAVRIGNPANLRLQNFTIETWMRRSDSNVVTLDGIFGSDAVLFSYGQAGYGFGLRSDGRPFLSKIGLNNVTLGVSLTDTQWHHLAVTKQGSNVVLYVDGVSYSVPPYDPGFEFVTDAALGTRGDNGRNTFFGAIDELAVYNRGLTAAEIQAIYTASTFGKCPSPPNQLPQANSQVVSLDEDSSRNITLTGSDPDGNPLTYLIVNAPTNGTLTGTAPNLVYTPAANYFGPDSFRFRVNDGLTSSPPATVTINVLPVNDVPVAQSQSLATDEDTALVITLGGSDADGDSLTYEFTAPTNGTLSGTAPNLTYTPAANYHGPDGFTFTVSDAVSTSAVTTVSIVVRSINDLPVARIEVSPLTQVLGITNKVVIAAVCGDATVDLDGSASSDVENGPLTFAWTEGTNWLGATAIITNQFSIGTHEITLTVNDGALNGVAHEIVEVVSPAQGLGIIVAYLEDSDLGRRNGTPLIASLKAAAASFNRCRIIPGVNQLHAFQNMVRVQIAPLDPDMAARLIEAAQQIIDAVQAEQQPPNRAEFSY